MHPARSHPRLSIVGGALALLLALSGLVAIAASAASSFTLNSLSATVGTAGSVSANASVTSSTAVTATSYGICARSSSGAKVDFTPKRTNVAFAAGVAQTVSATNTFAADTYTYWACVNVGGVWQAVGASQTFTVDSTPPPPPPGNAVTKVLVVPEENSSLNEMEAGMPYTWGLAQQYGYATNYKAIRHPSLPNYLAITGGSTFGITADGTPATYPINAQSVFGQALATGHTAKVYAETMPSNCYASNSGRYGVRHTGWPYYTPAAEVAGCKQFDVPETQFAADVTAGALPTVGMLVPNTCSDAHSCALSVADSWFKTRMQEIMAGPDWASGHLAVVLTADEDDGTQGNTVLTAVFHPSQSAHVVTAPLNHYSLTRLLEDVAHAPYLLNAATAADMAAAFGLPIG